MNDIKTNSETTEESSETNSKEISDDSNTKENKDSNNSSSGNSSNNSDNVDLNDLDKEFEKIFNEDEKIEKDMLDESDIDFSIVE